MLGLLWRDRRVQAGAFLAGSALPWTRVWGYYAFELVRGVPGEPFQIWMLFLLGLAPTLIGLGLMVAGDPLPPEPSPSAPAGRPGSRRVGIVAQTVLAPESIGPIPISEIAAFVTAVVTVLAVGLVGIPFPWKPSSRSSSRRWRAARFDSSLARRALAARTRRSAGSRNGRSRGPRHSPAAARR